MTYRLGRGDYIAGYGDPGLFGFIGNLLKPAIGAVVGTVTGGPIGGIIGALKGTASAVSSGVRTSTLEAGGTQSAYTPQLQRAHAQAVKAGQARAAIATRTVGAGAGHITAPIAGSLAGTPHGGKLVSVGGGGGRRRRRSGRRVSRGRRRAGRRRMTAKQRRYFGKRRGKKRR
jgi:hypothetical protein